MRTIDGIDFSVNSDGGFDLEGLSIEKVKTYALEDERTIPQFAKFFEFIALNGLFYEFSEDLRSYGVGMFLEPEDFNFFAALCVYFNYEDYEIVVEERYQKISCQAVNDTLASVQRTVEAIDPRYLFPHMGRAADMVKTQDVMQEFLSVAVEVRDLLRTVAQQDLDAAAKVPGNFN